MTGPVTRKIEIAKQIEELVRICGEAGELRAAARRNRSPMGQAEDRIARREGALATLRFCQQHEHEIRQWMAERKAAEAASGTKGTD